ncbi:23609_t:CDS:2, partial [Cetraspora pellucida]
GLSKIVDFDTVNLEPNIVESGEEVEEEAKELNKKKKAYVSINGHPVRRYSKA